MARGLPAPAPLFYPGISHNVAYVAFANLAQCLADQAVNPDLAFAAVCAQGLFALSKRTLTYYIVIGSAFGPVRCLPDFQRNPGCQLPPGCQFSPK